MKYMENACLVNGTNLFIVDGHKSHLYNLPFYEAMRANNVEVLHTTSHVSPITIARLHSFLERNLIK